MELRKDEPELLDFFGGQLHNYWPEEYGTWENALNDYLSQITIPIIKQIRKELGILIAANHSEKKLRRIITDDLCGNIYPPGSGLTHQQWLEKVDAMAAEWIEKKHLE